MIIDNESNTVPCAVCLSAGKEEVGAEVYKCDICGAMSDTHDASHGCGADHHLPMCQTCADETDMKINTP